jgi:hypothetical protein
MNAIASDVADAVVAICVARAKEEVLNDAGSAESSSGGTMPEFPASFSELHDYVDANEYGGLCDDGVFETVRALEEATGRNLVDEVQGAVDAWLRERLAASLVS